MDENDWDTEELRRRLALAHAKLARHEHLIGLILGFLTVLTVLAVGLVIDHIVGGPLLPHRR